MILTVQCPNCGHISTEHFVDELVLELYIEVIDKMSIICMQCITRSTGQ